MKIILASASPRRAELLRSAAIPFDVLVTDSDETARPGEPAAEMVRRLAEIKARAAVAQLANSRGENPGDILSDASGETLRKISTANSSPAIVLGADTVVEFEGHILGKPGSAENARRMLRLLSGNTHTVLTGIALIRLPDLETRFAVETTTVRFSRLTPEEIDGYVATGEPLDKAGAYAVQGIAGRFVERIEGCYSNVVGLPVSRVYRMLLELGWPSTPTA